MNSITSPPQYAEPTTTAPLERLANIFLAQLCRERKWLLEMVDQRERILIEMGQLNGPRTAQMRKWWWEQQG